MHVNNAVLAVVEGGRGRPAAGQRQRGAQCQSVGGLGGGGGKGENKSARCYSLLVGDGLVAAVAHAHLELEAHEGDGGALGRAFAAHGLAALPAVVLEEAGRAYYYHHGTKQHENEGRKMKSCHYSDYRRC